MRNLKRINRIELINKRDILFFPCDFLPIQLSMIINHYNCNKDVTVVIHQMFY